MEKLEALFTAGEDCFLFKLRMHDIFDDELLARIKEELSAILDNYKDQDMIPKFLLPLFTDVYIVMYSFPPESKNFEKINIAIDQLSSIIRDKLI